MHASLEPVVEQPVAASDLSSSSWLLASPAGAGRGASRRMPQVGQDVDATPFQFGGLRVLILVDHVLAEALRHQH